MANKKKSDIEDLQKIRSDLTTINGIHEDSINLQLDATIIALKKFILVKQNKLEKEIMKLCDMTTDQIASGLLDSIITRLHKTGTKYSQILNLESKPTNSKLEQMELMATIIPILQQLIDELQEIEDFLNIDV